MSSFEKVLTGTAAVATAPDATEMGSADTDATGVLPAAGVLVAGVVPVAGVPVAGVLAVLAAGVPELPPPQATKAALAITDNTAVAKSLFRKGFMNFRLCFIY